MARVADGAGSAGADGAGEGLDLSLSVIGPEVVVRGDVSGRSDLHVHGQVVGSVEVHGLVLEPGAVIEGPVTASAVVLSGAVTGAVEAKAVHLTATSRVEGDMTYDTLQIDAGARVSGQVSVAGAKPAEPAEPAADAPVRRVRAAERAGAAGEEPSDTGREFARMAARLRQVAE
jgi:cytoskeletal protein CcmA (bactofilin family)